MSLFSIMSKIAREMDKQRFENMKRQEQAKLQEPFIDYEETNVEDIITENKNLYFVEEHIEEVLGIYNNWAENYLELERIREIIDVEYELEDFIQNIVDSILISQAAYEEIELVSEVFEVPIVTQQYLSKVKENFLLALQCHVRKNEAYKDGVIEIIETGEGTEYPVELAIQLLEKAEFYLESGRRYIEKAVQSVSE